MIDARLQELYQRALDARAEPVRVSCPSPERVRALVMREGSEASRLETLDHVMACRACQREFELLRAIVVAAPAAPAARRWGGPRSLALAASLLIVIAGATLTLRARSHRHIAAVMRGAGAQVRLIPPDPSAARVLRWHAVPGAVAYVVEALTNSGAVLAADTTRDTTATLPGMEHRPPGAGDLWWVRARRADGSEARSRMQPLAGER